MAMTKHESTTVMTIASAVNCGKLPLFQRSSSTRPMTGLVVPDNSAEAVNSPTMWMNTITQPAARLGNASGRTTRHSVRCSDA
jgi:hypothetical protein